MSVIIEIAEPYIHCNSCGSNDRVIVMCVGKTTFGSQIASCESCAQKLILALNSRYKGYGEQDE